MTFLVFVVVPVCYHGIFVLASVGHGLREIGQTKTWNVEIEGQRLEMFLARMNLLITVGVFGQKFASTPSVS